MSTSPTQRSKAKLKADGYMVEVTERWNPFARCRKDLFGFIDILALRGDETLAVQTTSGDNVAHRVHKIIDTQAVHEWLNGSRKIVVHGWSKRGERGKRKLWTCREVYLTKSPDGILANGILVRREGA